MSMLLGTRPPVATVPIAVYGHRWCGITQTARRLLDRAGVEFAWVDLDLHPDAERKLSWLAGGSLRTPVVYVDGEWLMEPSMQQLRLALARHGVAS
jgi:mycoredoxin